MMPLPLSQFVVQQITSKEITQGRWLVAEANCEADVYVMPIWSRRGALSQNIADVVELLS